jgi:hypothetical protein
MNCPLTEYLWPATRMTPEMNLSSNRASEAAQYYRRTSPLCVKLGQTGYFLSI